MCVRIQEKLHDSYKITYPYYLSFPVSQRVIFPHYSDVFMRKRRMTSIIIVNVRN